MTTHHHFIAAILCQLGDVAPVLLYADWLEEQGDEECAWWRELAEALRAVRILRPRPQWLYMTINHDAYLVSDNTVSLLPHIGHYAHAGRIANALQDEFGRIVVIVFLERLQQMRDGPPVRQRMGMLEMFLQATEYDLMLLEPLPNQPIMDATPRHSATIPLSRLAPGVRRRLEQHPNAAELQAWLPQILRTNQEELDALQAAPEVASVRFSCQVEHPITLEMEGVFPPLSAHPDT